MTLLKSPLRRAAGGSSARTKLLGWEGRCKAGKKGSDLFLSDSGAAACLGQKRLMQDASQG